MNSRTIKAIGAGCSIAAALAVTAPTATATATDDDGVHVAGRCSGATSSELGLERDDGRIEVELEVDQNRTGVRWRVELRRAGKVVFSGTRRTAGRSGSFSLERKIARSAAPVTIRARATRAGEVCTATARI
jgi:hypothetical protein